MIKTKQKLLMFGVIAIIIITIITGCAQKGDVIRIGSIVSLTGDTALVGQNARQAMELAVEEINKKGIDGRRLEIIYEDGRCSAKDAADAANKLVNIDKVPVIIGGFCSSETLAAAPVAEGKTVLFSPCSSNPKVTDAGDYVFRDYPSDSFQGFKAAGFAYSDLSVRKVAILYCFSDWCEGLRQVFKKRFTELGGKVLLEEGYEQDTKDLRTQLTKIKQADPELIYFLGYTGASILGLKQIQELGINIGLLGGDAWSDPEIHQKAGGAAEGIIFFVPYSPLTDNFISKMKERTRSDEITACVPQAYDAVNIIADIIRKAGTDSKKIKEELYKVKDYQGVSGTITLDENGDLVSADYAIQTIKDGKVVEYKE